MEERKPVHRCPLGSVGPTQCQGQKEVGNCRRSRWSAAAAGAAVSRPAARGSAVRSTVTKPRMVPTQTLLLLLLRRRTCRLRRTTRRRTNRLTRVPNSSDDVVGVGGGRRRRRRRFQNDGDVGGGRGGVHGGPNFISLQRHGSCRLKLHVRQAGPDCDRQACQERVLNMRAGLHAGDAGEGGEDGVHQLRRASVSERR